jgi:hypothetical protein
MLKYTRQTGNVLFIILIAVALFAALTYAVSSSQRTGGVTMDKERGTIGASDYMSYTSNMEKIVARMLNDEISENGLSFENGQWVYNNAALVETASMFPNCTVAKCKVFDGGGGGVLPRKFTSVTVTSPVATDIASGSGAVYSLKVTGVGSTAWDLVLLIAIVDQNTCIQINNALGITNPAGVPPTDTWANAALYNGTFTGPNNATDEIGDMATQINGKTSGCITRSGGAYGVNDNYMYQVLLPR